MSFNYDHDLYSRRSGYQYRSERKQANYIFRGPTLTSPYIWQFL